MTSPVGTVQYAYGLDGNLYNAVLADGRAVALAYDESGNRIQRSVNGSQTTKWVWDTNAALPVRTNETGSSTYRWFEDPQSSLGTAVASVSKDGEATWLLTDFSGTTLTTAKTAGATSSAKFDAFGNITSGSMSQPLQFHGQYKDSVLGLYDMRQRDYNPATGMFLATDPIPVPVGDPFISRYSYGFNNPLVFADPSGLRATCAESAYNEMSCMGSTANRGVDFHTGSTSVVHTRAPRVTKHGGPPRHPSALPSVISVELCTTSWGPVVGTGQAAGQSFLGQATEPDVYSVLSPPEPGLFNPAPGSANPSAWNPEISWNSSILQNKWLLRGARAAPYLDYVSAGLEWNNNYNYRYSWVEDDSDRAKYATERTVVTSTAGIGTAAIVTVVASALLCAETVGLTCVLGAAVLGGSGAYWAESAAGSAYDRGIGNHVMSDVPMNCYSLPVYCLPTSENEAA